jgi:hypothetical protein
MLDKFFACSRTRPVSIIDTECTLALPCSEEAFREETPEPDVPQLTASRESFDFESRARLDGFAVLVIMCSLMDRCMRSLLRDVKITTPCWDNRSDFSATSSMLMSFESMHSAGQHDLAAHITEKFGTYEGYDRQKAGQFVWSRGMYHLCGIMLYHPFTLYRQRQACVQNFPPTFAREILSRCHHHLDQLMQVLTTVQSTGCCARGSFLGYFAAAAASLHKIFLHSTTNDVAIQATRSLDKCMIFLNQPPVCWPNYQTMVSITGVTFAASTCLERAVRSTKTSACTHIPTTTNPPPGNRHNPLRNRARTRPPPIRPISPSNSRHQPIAKGQDPALHRLRLAERRRAIEVPGHPDFI